MKKIKALAIAVLALSAFEASAQRALVQYNYTGGARAQRGGDSQIQSAIRNGHNRTNGTNRNSQTGASVGIAVMRFVNFNDNGRNLRNAFSAMTSGNLSGQRTDERNRRADMAMVVSNAALDGIRGIAQLPGPYSCVGSRFVSSSVTPHELGHNYSAQHNQAGPPININGRTSYTTMRTGVSQNSRIQYYSNPNVRYRGRNTSCCGRNNAARVRGQRSARANRR